MTQSGKEFLMSLPDEEIEAALDHTANALTGANINRSTFLSMSDDELDQLTVENDISERELTTAWLYWTLYAAAPIALPVSSRPGFSPLSNALAEYLNLRPLRDVLKLAA